MDSDAEIASRGLDFAKPDAQHVVSLMRVLHDYARESIRCGSVAPLMDFFYRNLALTLRNMPQTKLSCRTGCAHCCHSWVGASAPEVLHVVKSMNRPDRAHFQLSVAAMLERSGGKAQTERLKMVTPCPLLRDNLCGVYEFRPLVCRTCVSTDVDVCERSFKQLSGEEVPTPAIYTTTKGVYALVLAGALRRAKLPYLYYEYHSALQAALHALDAEAEWLAGKDIFAVAQADPSGDMFADDWNRQIYDAAFPQSVCRRV